MLVGRKWGIEKGRIPFCQYNIDYNRRILGAWQAGSNTDKQNPYCVTSLIRLERVQVSETSSISAIIAVSCWWLYINEVLFCTADMGYCTSVVSRCSVNAIFYGLYCSQSDPGRCTGCRSPWPVGSTSLLHAGDPFRCCCRAKPGCVERRVRRCRQWVADRSWYPILHLRRTAAADASAIKLTITCAFLRLSFVDVLWVQSR